eukprot:605547-Hanusia_phi.AAC.1
MLDLRFEHDYSMQQLRSPNPQGMPVASFDGEASQSDRRRGEERRTSLDLDEDEHSARRLMGAIASIRLEVKQGKYLPALLENILDVFLHVENILHSYHSRLLYLKTHQRKIDRELAVQKEQSFRFRQLVEEDKSALLSRVEAAEASKAATETMTQELAGLAQELHAKLRESSTREESWRATSRRFAEMVRILEAATMTQQEMLRMCHFPCSSCGSFTCQCDASAPPSAPSSIDRADWDRLQEQLQRAYEQVEVLKGEQPGIESERSEEAEDETLSSRRPMLVTPEVSASFVMAESRAMKLESSIMSLNLFDSPRAAHDAAPLLPPPPPRSHGGDAAGISPRSDGEALLSDREQSLRVAPYVHQSMLHGLVLRLFLEVSRARVMLHSMAPESGAAGVGEGENLTASSLTASLEELKLLHANTVHVMLYELESLTAK